MFWNRQVRTSPALCGVSAPYGALSDFKQLWTSTHPETKKTPSRGGRQKSCSSKGVSVSVQIPGWRVDSSTPAHTSSGLLPNRGIPPVGRWASHSVILVPSSTSLSH